LKEYLFPERPFQTNGPQNCAPVFPQAIRLTGHKAQEAARKRAVGWKITSSV